MKKLVLRNLFDRSFLYAKASIENIEVLAQDIDWVILLKNEMNPDEQLNLLNQQVNKLSTKELLILKHFLDEFLLQMKEFDKNEIFRIHYKKTPERFVLEDEWDLTVQFENGNKKDIMIKAKKK